MATYYLKKDAVTATLTGTADFTNGSTTVTGTGTLFSTELQAGDYIRPTSGAQWYKVTAIGGDLSCTISPAFQQTTVTGSGIDQNRGDGSTTNPFCHLNQYTTDTVRTAGDELLVQLGETHLVGGLDIVFDEDGTSQNPIKITGSDWVGTSATANAVFDFGGTTEQIVLAYDKFWELDRIDVTNSTDELLLGNYNHGLKVSNSAYYGGADGIYLNPASQAVIDNCQFYSNTVYSLYVEGTVIVKGSTFDGGVATTDYGVNCSRGGRATLIDCALGQTTAHDIADIRSILGGEVNAFNCVFSVADVVDLGGVIRSFNHNQVLGAYKEWQYQGTIEKDTVEVRTGGAPSCIKATPNSNISTNWPLKAFEWQIDDVSAAAHTITVYVKSVGLTTAFPTASELYIEVEYYDAATGTTRTKAVSSEVLTADNTYTALTVTFTPGQAGPIWVRGFVATQIASESYYFDNQCDLV